MEHMVSMEDMKKYIIHCDECISDIISRSAKKGINPHEIELLHYLFENRKHAMEWMSRHSAGHDAYAMPAGAEQKSYFGG